MIVRALKIYFWLYVVFAIFSIFPIIILATEAEVPNLPGLYILAGHTLLFPAHGFLYSHTLPIHWLWWIWVPVITILTAAGTIGLLEIWDSISLATPEFHWSMAPSLIVHLPLFVMAVLYLVKNGRNPRISA